MTPGIEYALGAMLLFGLGDLVYKRGAAAGAQPHHFLMVQSWVFPPTVALSGLATGSLEFSAASVQWGALAGVFALVGFYNFAHSLRTGSISINAPVFRLSFVLTAALAVVLLGEPLTRYKVAGTAFAGAVDARVRPSRAALRYAPRAAVVLAFAFAFMVEGMKRAEASVVVPIAQMGFVVTALLGFLFLREPFTARKGVGVAGEPCFGSASMLRSAHRRPSHATRFKHPHERCAAARGGRDPPCLLGA